jgi:hypothetical protein
MNEPRERPAQSEAAAQDAHFPENAHPSRQAKWVVDSLNTMFDPQSSRVAALGNRVPTPVLALEVAGAAIAMAALALHLGTLGGRGVFTVTIAAALVIVSLLVTFDLDRPTRGLIRVPAAPLTQVRAGMVPPPQHPHPPGSFIRTPRQEVSTAWSHTRARAVAQVAERAPEAH